MTTAAPAPEPTFACERCGAHKRTHMLEVSEGQIVSFTRLCDGCLKLEFARHMEKRR